MYTTILLNAIQQNLQNCGGIEFHNLHTIKNSVNLQNSLPTAVFQYSNTMRVCNQGRTGLFILYNSNSQQRFLVCINGKIIIIKYINVVHNMNC